MAYNDTFKSSTYRFDALYFEAAHGQGFIQFAGREGVRNVILEPIITQLHLDIR